MEMFIVTVECKRLRQHPLQIYGNQWKSETMGKSAQCFGYLVRLHHQNVLYTSQSTQWITCTMSNHETTEHRQDWVSRRTFRD